jgi:hypothetical protein
MQLVVVIAVRNAVSAATITFTATSIILFFILIYLFTLFFLWRSSVTGNVTMGTATPRVISLMSHWFLSPV